jgi:light-regulated signal transduction histidine kinase (bacteriophytochrome)
MTERIETERNEKLYKLHHDIQNCLNVIALGTDMLAHARNDEDTFAEFYDSVREHRRTASKLMDEFLKTACNEVEQGDRYI